MTNAFNARLSVQQAEVVSHVEGPLLVIAGPGSGKTRVLTERIRQLLTNVPGHFRILALTFTNKAADEMRDRLLDLSDERERAFIGTLHSFCLDMLTERGKLVGVEGTPNIFEQFKDRKEVLLKAVDEDLLLSDEINQIEDSKERNRQCLLLCLALEEHQAAREQKVSSSLDHSLLELAHVAGVLK